MLYNSRLLAGAAIAVLLSVSCGGAVALDESKDEKSLLKSCEKSLCQLVTQRAPSNGNFSCRLAKTWRKQDLKEGASQGKASWFFGDAQCEVTLNLARGAILAALREGKTTLKFPEHTVNCLIDANKKATRVTAILAPKAEFEGGKVKSVQVNLKKFSGPTLMKGLAYATAGMEDKLGVFRNKLAGAVNKLLYERCPKIAAGK